MLVTKDIAVEDYYAPNCKSFFESAVQIESKNTPLIVNKHYKNKVSLRLQISIFKILPPSWAETAATLTWNRRLGHLWSEILLFKTL